MRAESLYSFILLRAAEGSPAGTAGTGGGSAAEGPACQLRPGSQTWGGGRGLPSSHRDRATNNKHNHTDT